MTRVTVRFLTNGYSVSKDGNVLPADPPETQYAVDLDEVAYWVAQMLGTTGFSPTGAVGTPLPYAEAVVHPMIGQEALVYQISDGTYITQANPNAKFGTPVVQERCVDIDAVRVALEKIYTYSPPAPPPP